MSIHLVFFWVSFVHSLQAFSRRRRIDASNPEEAVAAEECEGIQGSDVSDENGTIWTLADDTPGVTPCVKVILHIRDI